MKKPSFNNWLNAVSTRWFRKAWRWLYIFFICLLMIFSPIIVWVILSLNRQIIVVLANWQWLSDAFPSLFHTLGEHVNTPEFARGFNEAALGGLLTLFGVIVTVWYCHVIRIQEVTEKKLFVIDELLEELKKNRIIINNLSEAETDHKAYNQYHNQFNESVFYTEAWHKLGGDVATLPRKLYLQLSVLYSSLNQCSKREDYCKNKAVIDRIGGIIMDLHKYRGDLSKQELG